MKQKEFFSPLYISNYCDAHCKMCNLNTNNKTIIRKELTLHEIEDELNVLYKNNIMGVSFLTGEYYDVVNRQRMINLVLDACELAYKIGFTNIMINIGSLTEDEVLMFKELPFKVRLSLFMETYNKTMYEKWMSNKGGKADYSNRMDTYKYWSQHKVGSINLGILIGLNPDINKDIDSLIEHIDSLNLPLEDIYISLPKIASFNSTAQMNNYLLLFKTLSKKYKLILTNRENYSTIKELWPFIYSFSPGIPKVGAYAQKNNSKEQFSVSIEKKPWEILEEIKSQIDIENMSNS